ncbi:NAD(P)-binding protein [Curvularia clavata]|uniref:NAD(P)-binding protein n=1 Tax=Curvularia clavata TaxID=95742 RepID=A0A9Q9DWT4_CURCL|nr:NAD(P)-binding protein [Curvularia clavata]
MNGNSIAIFPASGGIGGSTYRHLLNLTDPKSVILVARNPANIPSSYKDAGVIVRYGDYDRLETLDHAFEGARCLNLISYASIEHEHRFQVQKYAIDAAVKCGITHVFYSSLGFAGTNTTTDSLAFVMQAHLDTEKYLARLAIEIPSFSYTVVRQGLYTESYGMYLGFPDLKNPPSELKIPHDGKGPGISWVKRDELGEGTAHLLAEYASDPTAFPYINKTLLLSGPEELSIEESVAAISRVVGKEIKVRQCSVDEWASAESVKGASKYLAGEMAKHWATSYDALRHGEGAVVTENLRRLIGREPERFEKTISDIAKA